AASPASATTSTASGPRAAAGAFRHVDQAGLGLRRQEPHALGPARKGRRQRLAVLRGKLPLVSDPSRGRRASDAPPDPPEPRPLVVLRQSRLFARALRRETVAVFGDRIEHVRPGLIGRTRTVTVRYEQVAQVSLDRRLVWR